MAPVTYYSQIKYSHSHPNSSYYCSILAAPPLQGSSSQATNIVTSDSESEEDRNDLELLWDRKEPVMLDMEERMMKEEDINDILTELPLPVG